MQAGNVEQRVFSIRNEDYLLNNLQNQSDIKSYWKQTIAFWEKKRSAEFTQNGTVKQIEEIDSKLDSIFARFSTINAPTREDLLFEKSFHAIREWLKDVIPETVLEGKKQLSDKTFIYNVEKEIIKIFKLFPDLYSSIKRESIGIGSEVDLAKMLCSNKNQSDLLGYNLIGECKEVVQASTKPKVHELKQGIRSLLNCLSVMAINPDWVKIQGQTQEKVISIPVATSFGEVAAAGRLGQVVPDILAKNGNVVTGKYEIAPFKTVSWDNAKDLVIDDILRFMFDEVFRDSPFIGSTSSNGKITEDQRIELNTQIKLNAADGSRHYYCMIRRKETEPHFFGPGKLIDQLKNKLPALDIFELEDPVGNVVIIGTNEVELSQTYHHFLTQLEQW